MHRTIEEVQAVATDILKKIPVSKFEDTIRDLPVRWTKCVEAGGNYFEGDGIQVLDFMVEISESESDQSEVEN